MSMNDYKSMFASWIHDFGFEPALAALEWFEDLAFVLVSTPVLYPDAMPFLCATSLNESNLVRRFSLPTVTTLIIPFITFSSKSHALACSSSGNRNTDSSPNP
jgi:hypothetical protein